MGFFSKSSNNSNDDNKWKQKYLDLLDAQELAEKSQKQNQDLLCKTITRLTIVVSGMDQDLDPYLHDIRENVKKGVDFAKLKNELENLTSAVARIDREMPEKDSSQSDISVLVAFLQQRMNSERHRQEILALESAFLADKDRGHLFAAANKLLDSEDETKTVIPETTLHHDADQPVSAVETATNITEFFSAPLIKLLDQIDIPEDYDDQADALKQCLENREQRASFESFCDGFSALLNEINAKNQSKQQEIDTFLAHITEKLTELGLSITDSGAALMDASLSRSKFDQSVSEQMDDLQHRSKMATQLEPLKEVISSHIAKITHEIQEQKQKEAAQRQKYQNQLEELSQKIKVMEEETGELQSKLVTANSNAQRDALTALPNRLAYDERLSMEFARWQRYHTPLCLAVIDIDYFKRINDQFGHQAGDKVLEQVSSLLLQNIRRSDFVARFGGEEFVMLLPHTNRHSAVKVTDKLRLMVEHCRFQHDELTIAATISCGITQFIKGDTHETAFKRADEALYQAKAQGRNRCCAG